MTAFLGTIENEFDILNLDGCGFDGDGQKLLAWDQEVLPNFGSLVGSLGFINEPDLSIEVDASDDLGDGTVRTPMLELSGNDFQYMQTVRTPYPGMKAISDLGDLYEYAPYGDGLGGLFKRIRKGVKRVRKKLKKKFGGRIRSAMRKLSTKLLSKTKFGRTAIRIGKKFMRAGMKIVKPLAKKVGKWAPRLAPIAALIPGVGTAAAGLMLKAGTIGKKLNRYGGKIENVLAMSQKTGKSKMIKALKMSPGNRKAMAKDLQREARRFTKLPKSKKDAMLRSLRQMDPKKHARPLNRLSRSTIASAAKLQRAARRDYNRDVHRKVLLASGGNKAKMAQMRNLIAALNRLGYQVA